MTALKFAPAGMLICALGVLLLKHGAGQPGWVFDWRADMPYLPWLALLFACGTASYVFAVRRRLDCVPLVLAYVLLAVGLAEIARLKPDLFVVQLRWACAGIVLWGTTVILWSRLRCLLDYPYVLGIATTAVEPNLSLISINIPTAIPAVTIVLIKSPVPAPTNF